MELKRVVVTGLGAISPLGNTMIVIIKVLLTRFRSICAITRTVISLHTKG